MKRVTDKMIKESVKLSECSPEDRIYIRDADGWCDGKRLGKYTTIGDVTLVRTKRLPKNIIQMKCKTRPWKGEGLVRKYDLIGDPVVERTRKATAADGPDYIKLDVQDKTVPVIVPDHKVEILDPLPPSEPRNESTNRRRGHDGYSDAFGLHMLDVLKEAVRLSGGSLRRIE